MIEVTWRLMHKMGSYSREIIYPGHNETEIPFRSVNGAYKRWAKWHIFMAPKKQNSLWRNHIRISTIFVIAAKQNRIFEKK